MKKMSIMIYIQIPLCYYILRVKEGFYGDSSFNKR